MKQRKEILAIIPARGGAVGIPRKNVRALGGRPLIAWTITQALRTEAVPRVVVSTDDREITQVSRAWGAEVIERPTTLAGPPASRESALTHTLDTLAARDGYVPDLVVFLQCTSPFRQPNDIGDAIATLVEAEAEKREAAQAQQRKLQVGSGDRSQRIRTYNFPQGRITDHRVEGLTLYDLPNVMEGQIDALVERLSREHEADALAQLTAQGG